MTLPHDPDAFAAARNLPTLTEELHRLAADALRLRALAHQAGLFVMAMGLGLPGHRGRAAEVRRVMREIEGTLVSVREAETRVLPRISPASRARVAEALSPGALAPFDQALVQLGQIIARPFQAAPPDRPGQSIGDTGSADLARSELFRLLSTDLDRAVKALEQAAKAALTEALATPEAEALVDDLTGLPNRRAFYRLAADRWAATGPAIPMTLMRIDVDHLRSLEDTSGPGAAEAALCRMAAIMQSHLRSEDFVARMGKDAFALVLCGDHAPETATRRAAHLIHQIGLPFDHEGQPVRHDVSVGIVSVRPGELLGLDRLLHNAELALFAAKAAGPARFLVYTPELRNRHDSNQILVSAMADGLQRGEFVPYFQPQVDARNGRIVGLEALARWNHPVRGVLAPYHFLDLARQADLLDPLDIQITRAAVLALGAWQAAGRDVPRVTVNITARRLALPGLCDELAALARDAGLPPSAIGLEIPEDAMIGSGSDAMIQTVRDLSDAGFAVELDDFGTGHASIANLRHFRVSRIKIDRTFIKDIHLQADLSKITAAMIGLAHSLRIDALGMGVETPEERLVLNALGVDHLQGFGVARPMPQNEVEGWLRRTQSRPVLPPAPVRTG
jgi:diguanylate cyclase (GGDEF)-like protein